MEAFGGVITAFLIAALPLAVTVTKLVDTVRNLLGTAQAKVPKVVWNLLALVLGVIVAFAFEINLVAPIAAALPGLKDWTPSQELGELISGLAIGSMGSFWHEKMDEWSSIAKGASPPPPPPPAK
jgi:hypothetical protein